MASSSTGAAGSSRWRPLLTGVAWVLVLAAAFGGWQVWTTFLEPHTRTLVVEAERDPLSTARSNAERVLTAMEIEFRAPDTGAALMRLRPDPLLPRSAELTVRGRVLQQLVDEGRLEAWVHLGGSAGALDSARISAPLAPPRERDGALVYLLGLDDAVRILGRRVLAEIAVRDQVGLEVETLSSDRAGELVEDPRRPGVYRIGVGLSQVLRANEDVADLVIAVRDARGREGRLRVPPAWLDGSEVGDRVVRIEWTTEAPPSASTESSPPLPPSSSERPDAELVESAESVASAAAPRLDPPTPARPDPARVEADRRALITRLQADARAALQRGDLDVADRLATELGSVARADAEFTSLREAIEAARAEVQARQRTTHAREAVEEALAAADFETAAAALGPAARAGLDAAQIESWRTSIERGRVAAAEQAAAAALLRDQQGVNDALAELERAFDELDLDRLYRVFPEYPAPRKDLADNWKYYVSQDLTLEPLGEVEIDGDRASIECRRSFRQELKQGQQPIMSPDRVRIEFRREGGVWRVTGWERLR